jgi:two-component system chemotaxis response regulator CheB
MEDTCRIVAVGASAGGRAAIMSFLENVPPDINAAFLVVVHTAFDTPSFFAEVLSKKTELKVENAAHGSKITRGCVYVAKPNHHLFVNQGALFLSKGPRENLFRPAVDVLFRSTAVTYGNRSVGVLMTGRLNDGTAGLEAIKKCGGLAVIQNPDTAEYDGMPSSALQAVNIDHVVDLEHMSETIEKILEEELPPETEIPQYLIRENSLANKIKSKIDTQDRLGHQVPVSCSSCGGPLWKVENSDVQRYRCHVGHAFSEEALLAGQNEALEEALWVSMRTLEEKRMLLDRLAKEYREKGPKSLAESYKDKAAEVSDHIGKLRNVLQLQD